MPLLLKQDMLSAAKRPQCVTGEPCGNTCIDPNETCTLELSPEMRARVEGLRTTLLNTVPGYSQFNTARAVVNDFKRVRESGDRAQQAMYLGALLLGTSVLGYATFRDKYRDGFINSAEVALRRSKGMANSIPDIGGKENIIFTVDSSLSKGDKGRGGGLAAELMADEAFAAKYHIVSIKQNAHFAPKDMESLNGRDRRIAEAMVPIKQAVMNARNGQSDAAVELASQILAYHDKHGKATVTWKETTGSYGNQRTETKSKVVSRDDFRMNILGHGDGGMVASEAMEILKLTPEGRELAGRIKVVSMNTLDPGLTDTVGDVKTIASRNSPLSLLPMKNKITMDAPDGDGGRAMLRKKAVREFIDGHFGGKVAEVVRPAAEAPKTESPKPPVTQSSQSTQSTGGQQTLNLQTPQSPVVQKTAQQLEAERVAKQESTQRAIALVPKSTFSESSGVSKTSTLSSGENEGIAESRRRMVSLSNRIAALGTANIDKALVEFPNATAKEIEQATALFKAPKSIKELLISGHIQPKPAARIAALMRDGRDRGDFDDVLADIEITNPLNLHDSRDVDYLIEEFKAYRKTMRGDSAMGHYSFSQEAKAFYDRADSLLLRIDALDSAAPVCKKGKPCNGRCIPQSWNCGRAVKAAISVGRFAKKVGAGVKAELKHAQAVENHRQNLANVSHVVKLAQEVARNR